MKDILRIGARASQLSLRQAEWVSTQLTVHSPQLHIEITTITTAGDRDQDRKFADMGVTGVFTREIDRALLEGKIDVAVHSLKDLPTIPTQGLTLSAVPCREDPRDAFISLDGRTLVEMDPDAKIGTSSVRREAQLRVLRSDLQIVALRGNVDTRIRKLRESKQYDGIIIAYAGLKRLDRADEATEILETERWLPAPGQGALALVTRESDETIRALVQPLDDPDSHLGIVAERTLLESLGAGCHVPVGAYARIHSTGVTLDGFISEVDGSSFVRDRIDGRREEAAMLGRTLAQTLREQFDRTRKS